MNIAVLETGAPPPPLESRFGRYDGMFRDLLGDEYVSATYNVAAGFFPEAPDAHDAYLLSGSPAGVYDEFPWIATLRTFLQSAKGRAKLVGVCFGHQIMADAFGGKVVKSEKGWGAGLHRYDVWERASWMDEAGSVAIPASHQDQVVEPPPHARVLAVSDFTPFGVIAYEDQQAISFQCHPEFHPDYARALVEARRERVNDPDGAIASLDLPDDRPIVAGWIRRFLDQ